MTRDKKTIKFTKPIFSNKEGLSLSTPEIVAKYIAKRLKTDIIADLGCGIGGQVIFFAKECKKVYAVERNPEKLEYAKKNCELYNVNNVEFILGDALSEDVKNKVVDANIIFSDPARPLSEKERSFETLEPPINEIIKLYSDITEKLAFHAPPQMPPSRIVGDCEREYLSLNGQLNRLTLYFGSLKKCERSAVVLPEEANLCSDGSSFIKTCELSKYVYEPEPSVVKAEILGEAVKNLDDEVLFYKGDEKRTLLTSLKLVDSPFFKDTYKVITEITGNILKLNQKLKSLNAKNVVLRFDVEPEKYWKLRNEIEVGLNGTKTFHVFDFGNEFLICEKIKMF